MSHVISGAWLSVIFTWWLFLKCTCSSYTWATIWEALPLHRAWSFLLSTLLEGGPVHDWDTVCHRVKVIPLTLAYLQLMLQLTCMVHSKTHSSRPGDMARATFKRDPIPYSYPYMLIGYQNSWHKIPEPYTKWPQRWPRGINVRVTPIFPTFSILLNQRYSAGWHLSLWWLMV